MYLSFIDLLGYNNKDFLNEQLTQLSVSQIFENYKKGEYSK